MICFNNRIPLWLVRLWTEAAWTHDSIYGEKDVGPCCKMRRRCGSLGRCHARLYSLIETFFFFLN